MAKFVSCGTGGGGELSKVRMFHLFMRIVGSNNHMLLSMVRSSFARFPKYERCRAIEKTTVVVVVPSFWVPWC